MRSLSRQLLAMSLLTAAAAPAIADTTGIHVNGSGEIRAVPDMARVSLQVRREGEDAAALKSQLDEVTAHVLEMTRDMGIDKRLVTAAAVNIHPRYRPRDGETELDGLIATRSIEIVLEDLADVSPLINGALARGVNGVGGIQLDLSNRASLEQNALDLAVDDARDEAARVARRFSVALGAVIDVSVDQHDVRPVMMEAATARAADGGADFSAGELTIQRRIRATFEIGGSADQ